MMKVIILLSVLGCWENKDTTETQNYGTTDDPAEICSVHESPDETPIESTCSDSKIECHWQVVYCEEWYDAPTDCAKLAPPAVDENYGTTTWENYYCACDMKCHPKGECKDKSDMIQQKCSAKYGWPSCPDGAFSCYWKDVNGQNVHCPIPKCCGGWCPWDPC